MTETPQTAAAARWEALKADPDYARENAKHDQTLANRGKARRDALEAMGAIRSLLLASEAAARQTWALEGIEEKESEALENATGDCAECWFSAWSSAEDAAADAAMDTAIRAADLVNRYRKLVTLEELDRAALGRARTAALARIDAAAAS